MSDQPTGPPEDFGVNLEVDGLTLSCGKCGDAVPFDVLIADETWRDVPDVYRLGVLCLSCMDRVLPAGLAVGDVLLVYATMTGGTLPLVPWPRVVALVSRLEEQAREIERLKALVTIGTSIYCSPHWLRHATPTCPACRAEARIAELEWERDEARGESLVLAKEAAKLMSAIALLNELDEAREKLRRVVEALKGHDHVFNIHGDPCPLCVVLK